MKKLLIYLIAIFCISLAKVSLANDLPIGHYTGHLTTANGKVVNGSGAVNPQGISISLGPLPELHNIPGTLTAKISLKSNDCFGGKGKLRLARPYQKMTWLKVKASNCKWNGTTFTGYYLLTDLKLAGSFTFTEQDSKYIKNN